MTPKPEPTTESAPEETVAEENEVQTAEQDLYPRVLQSIVSSKIDLDKL